MSTPAAHTRSRIRRLTVRAAPSADVLRARQAVELSVATAELEPAGWPARALLLVRDVGMRVRAGSLASSPRALGAALREQLTVLARDAVAPRSGRLPASARAVRFDDTAEALALFALAAVERRAAAEWWWRLLWGEVDPHDWVAIWRSHAGDVPAALAYLAADGTLNAVARSVSADAGHALLGELVSQFGLHHLGAALAPSSPASTPRSPTDHSAPRAAAPGFAVQAGERELAELSAVAVESGLPPAVRAWIAAGIGLTREPWRVRSASFAATVATVIDPLAAHARTATGATDVASAAQALEPSSAAPRDRPARTAGSGVDQDVDPAPRTGAASSGAPRGRAGTQGRDGGGGDTRTPRVAHAPQRARDVPVQSSTAEPEPLPAEELVRSAFGGVFYVANAALALELYPDFTRPGQPAIDLPFWDLLAVAGVHLAQDAAQAAAFRADPLWAWFARLSGRAVHEPPGAGVPVPRAFHFPDGWRAWAGTDAPDRDRAAMVVSTWDDWCAAVMPWIDRRMRLGLGEPPARFMRQTGVVVRAHQRIDVHFALALHPLELRLAGLDRDPGWIPAAGADLRFVYE